MTKSSALTAIGIAAFILNSLFANAQCSNATVASASFCEGQRAEITLTDADPLNSYHWYRDGDLYDLGYGNSDKGKYFVSPSDIPTGTNSVDFWYSRERPEMIGPPSTIALTNGQDAAFNLADYEMKFDAQTDFRLNSITFYSKVNYADPAKTWGFQVRIATAAQLANPAQGQFSNWTSYRFTTSNFEKIVLPVNLDIKAGTAYTIQIKSGNTTLNLSATDLFYWYNTTSYASTSYLTAPAQISINPVTKSIYSTNRIPLIEDWNITVNCPRVKVTATKRTTGCCEPAGSTFQINSPVAVVRDSDLPLTLTATGADAAPGYYYMWFDESKNLIPASEGVGTTSLQITKAGTYYVRVVKDAAFKNSYSCYKENSKFVQKRILFATTDKKEICLGESATLIASGATANITWTPTTGLTPTTGKVVKATPTTVGKQLYTVSATVPVGNIVVDGDFDESTITAPKFETKYNLVAEIPNASPNNHATIGARAYAAWGGEWAKFCDDTAGFYTADRGPFLYADAASSSSTVPADWGTNNYLWQQSNLPVFPNTNYEFRFLVTDWGVENLADATKTADIQMYVNGQPLLVTPLEINKRCRWTEVKATWNSGSNTSVKLTISDVNAQNYGGEYAIDDISFGAPGTQTDTVSVNVKNCITCNQPKVTVSLPTTKDTTLCVGKPFTLRGKFVNGPNPTYDKLYYVWYKKGQTPTASRYKLVPATNVIPDSVITSVTAASAGTYILRVQDGRDPLNAQCYGEDTVKVRTNPITTITTQPATPTSLCEGQNLNLTVVAAGTGPFTYQWKKNGSDSIGATASALSVASVVPGNAGTYSVVVTGLCGSATSTDAVVTIITKPKITAQPVSTGGCIGSSTSLSVTATGTPTLHYQWKKAGNVGTDSPTLNFTSLAAEDAGNYTVDISNSCGTVTSNIAKVDITLNETPSVTLVTDSVLVCGNGTSIVTLTASGTGGGSNPLYTFKVGTDVIGAADQPFFSHIYTIPANTGTTAQTLSFTVEMTSNSTCLASGASRTATSVSKTLDVDAQVSSANIIPTKQTICTDGMTLTADAIPTGYQGTWRKYQGSTGSGAIGNTSGVVSGILAGDAPRFEYLVESPLKKCPSKSDTVTIVRAGTLTSPNAGVAPTVCSNATSVTLTGNGHRANETATWAKVNPADPIVLTQSGDNATLTGIVAGEYKFAYTLTNGICPALSDTVAVTVDQFVQAVLDNTVPNPRSTCATSITLPGGITPSIATSTGKWSIKVGSPNTATITTPSDSISSLTNLPNGGTVMLVWEAQNGVCPISTVNFTVKQVGSLTTPTISIHGGIYSNKNVTDKTADTLCVNATYSLTGSTPDGLKNETGAWTLIDAGTTGIAGIATGTLSQNIRPTAAGTAVLKWTISPDAAVPGCTPEEAEVTLIVHDVPQGGVITGNDFLCEGTDTVYTLNPASTSTLPVLYTWNVGAAPQGATLQGSPTGTNANYLFTSDVAGTISQGILTAVPSNLCGANVNAIANKVVGIRLAPRSFVSAPNDTLNGPSAFCATSPRVKYKLDYLQPNTDNNGYVWYWNNQVVTSETDTSALILQDWPSNASSTAKIRVELTNRCSTVKPATILTPFREKEIKIIAPDALSVSLSTDKTLNKFCEPDDKVLFTASPVSQLPGGVTGTFKFYLNDTTGTPLPITVPSYQYEFAIGVLKDKDNVYVKFKADPDQCLTVDSTTTRVLVDGYRYPDSTLIVNERFICDNESTTLRLNGIDKNTGEITWYKGNTIVDKNTPSITLGDASQSGTYRVEIAGTVCVHVSKSDSARIKIYDTPEPVFAPNPLLIFYDQNSTGIPMPLVSTGTTDTLRTIDYSPSLWLDKTNTLYPLIKTSNEEGQFQYVLTLSTGTPDGHPTPKRCSYPGTITIINTLPLLIPNAFSPNGDGKNERWEIDGLGKYPSTKVKVFNRWGNAMFTDNNGYKVPWDGTHNGAQLPSGTYYYVIELEGSPDDSDNVRTGSLTIVR